MSEHILKAIVQLFALLARIDGLKESERQKIIQLISNTIGESKIGDFIEVFDLYSGYEPSAEEEYQFRKEEDIFDKIAAICHKIKKEANLSQRISLLSQFIQLIIVDDQLSELENTSLNIIARELNVSDEILKELKQFILAGSLEAFNSSEVLIVKANSKEVPSLCRFLKASNLSGYIAILHLKNIKTLYARYMGDDFILHNTIPIQKGKIELFPPGSNFRGDNLAPVYYSDIISEFKAETIDHKISFVADDISYRFKKGNYGLKGIDLCETEGRLVGIMGASGSGKSTLINVLNGNDIPSQGRVLVNGIDLHTQADEVEGIIGYVPQDDLLIEDLTVFQNLFYSAKLCFKDKGDEELKRLVDRILQDLGIFEIRNLKVGNSLNKTISGGQRKRVNIGLELLREPLIMFVDEPTSGLSSRDSENIMDLLKELSLEGKLIFVVIHQPSSDIFKMFDRLLILDVGGFPIYYGNPIEAINYFRDALKIIDRTNAICLDCGNVNTEQIFNIIELKIVDENGHETRERRYSPEYWHKIYKEKILIPKLPEINEPLKRGLKIPGRLKQIGIFVKRDFLAKAGNRQYVLINLLEAPLLGFILAFFIRYYPSDGAMENSYSYMENLNIPIYMFMAVIVALFMGLTVSAEEIIRDRKIRKREIFLHLSSSGYIASKLIILFSLSAIQALAFVLVGNLIMNIQGMLFVYWLIFFSVSCFGNVLGLNISSAFNSVVTIYILIPILLIPQLLLSGVMVKFDDLNPGFTTKDRVPLIGELMAAKWAYEALIVSQFRDNKYESNFYSQDKIIAESDYKTVYYLPRLMSKLDHLQVNLKEADARMLPKLENDVKVLHAEISKELKWVGTDKFKMLNRINLNDFDSAVYSSTKLFFETIKKVYQRRHQKAQKNKEELLRRLTETPEKRTGFERLKQNYYNEQVASVALNNKVATRIIEEDGELIQKIYPVYMDPVPAHFFDFTTQMYQPVKYFGGFYWDTLAFNIVVVWFMTFVLVLALYFEVLRKLVNRSF